MITGGTTIMIREKAQTRKSAYPGEYSGLAAKRGIAVPSAYTHLRNTAVEVRKLNIFEENPNLAPIGAKFGFLKCDKY